MTQETSDRDSTAGSETTVVVDATASEVVRDALKELVSQHPCTVTLTFHRPVIADDMRRLAAATQELAARQLPAAEREPAAKHEPWYERDEETGVSYLLMPTPTLFGKRWGIRHVEPRRPRVPTPATRPRRVNAVLRHLVDWLAGRPKRHPDRAGKRPAAEQEPSATRVGER